MKKKLRYRYFVAYETRNFHGDISFTTNHKIVNSEHLDEVREIIRQGELEYLGNIIITNYILMEELNDPS